MFSSEKGNLIPYLMIGGVVGIILLVVIGILVGRQGTGPEDATLEFWGFEDDQQMWTGLMPIFREQYPHISVTYKKLDASTYKEVLLNRLAEGRGPDIFMIKSSWLRENADKLIPMPQDIGYRQANFVSEFIDVASADMISKRGEILGMPLSSDSLALFYNKDMFNAAAIAVPPKDWDQVLNNAQTLTRLNAVGDVVRAGIAIGTAKNVEHAMEILSAMIFQNGETILKPDDTTPDIAQGARQAFDFYTSFADSRKQNFSWSERLPNSIDAFAEGKAAMMFGFQSDIKRVREKNPHLNFGIARFPQPRGVENPIITYGAYTFPVVSRQTKSPISAWQFLIGITRPAFAVQYLQKTGRPPARRDIISGRAPTVDLDVFYDQALTAKSWPIPKEDTMRNVFAKSIGDVLTRSLSTDRATFQIQQQLQLLIQSQNRL